MVNLVARVETLIIALYFIVGSNFISKSYSLCTPSTSLIKSKVIYYKWGKGAFIPLNITNSRCYIILAVLSLWKRYGIWNEPAYSRGTKGAEPGKSSQLMNYLRMVSKIRGFRSPSTAINLPLNIPIRVRY